VPIGLGLGATGFLLAGEVAAEPTGVTIGVVSIGIVSTGGEAIADFFSSLFAGEPVQSQAPFGALAAGELAAGELAAGELAAPTSRTVSGVGWLAPGGSMEAAVSA
jgi:hypothetical protein